MNKDEDLTGGLTPYAPPRSEADARLDGPLVSAREQGLGTQAVLVPVLHASLGIQALLQGVKAGSCLVLAGGVVFGEDELAVLSLSQVAAKTISVIFFAGVIPFAWFLADANKTARAFLTAAERPDTADGSVDGQAGWYGTEPAEDRSQDARAFTPAAMVWSFFVPFLNLVRPYLAVKAVWASSAPERGGVEVARGGILGPWWAAWLVSTTALRASSYLKGLEPLTHNLVVALTSALGLTSCLLALRMVRALHLRQRQRAAELWPSRP